MSKFRTRNWIARSVVLLVTLLFAVPFVSAQVTTGNLQGIVKDPNGAVVAGAAIKITNASTGVVRETTSNDEGFYRVTNLLPGDNYTVEVTAAGFQTKTVEKVPVRLGSENTADVDLGVAGGEANVQVTGEQPLIQTQQSQLSQSFTPQQLTQLPFNGLIDNLALLTPGVVTPGDADFTNGVGISANGNRGRSNNFQIDGQDNNDNSVAGPSLFVSNGEAIGEFQVITNSFSAEFGRNSGAQVNTITKSGTNEFHGALFEYHANSALDARNNIEEQAFNSYAFLSRNGVASVTGLLGRDGKNVFNQNRFGGAIGGPIKKNKVFFFVTYQGDRTRGEADVNNITSATLTPTLASVLALPGIPGLSAAAVAAITSTGIGGGPATAQGVGTLIVIPPTIDTNGDAIPDAFQFGPGNPFGQPVTPGFFAPLAVVADPTAVGGRRVIFGGEQIRIIPTNAFDNQIIGKIDWNPTSKDTIVGRYIFDNAANPLATGRFLAGAIFDVPSRNNNLGITYTRTLSANWVNEARFNFSRLDVKFGDPAGPRPGTGVSFSGTRDEFSNLQQAFGTQNNLPQSRLVDVYQYQDTMSATIGNHSMRFGADIRQQKVQNFFLPNFLGTFTFNGSNTSTAAAGTLPAGIFFRYGTNGLDGAPRNGARAWAFENFLLGRPRQINFALGNPAINTDQNDFFFFFQDDWRIRPNLTLNLGVRYEVSTQPFNPIIQQINAREADATTAIFDPVWPLGFRTATEIPIDKNNIAPRVGFAWQPNIKWLGDYFSNGHTVIRGGFGISYDPSFFNIVLNTVTAAPYAAAGVIVQTPGAVGSIPFPTLPTTRAQLNVSPGTNGGDPRLFNQTRVSPDFHNPYSMNWNFGIQQELFKNTVIEARYVGTRILDQFQTINGNPDLRSLARAGNFLFGDPTRFTGGVAIPSCVGPDPTCIIPNLANNFNSRGLDATGNRITGSGRLDPFMGPTRTRTNGASATYNGMQLRFDTRFWSFLTLDANYSLSKTIDNASEIFGTLGGGQGVAASQNPFNTTSAERGLSAFHQKHNFTTNFILELPWYKEQRGAMGKFLGGYQFASIIRFGSGRPYTPLEVLSRVDVAFEGAFINGVNRPFNGNPNAPVGTIAFGYSAACNVLFGGPECDYNGGTAVPGTFILYNTLSPGSTGVTLTPAQALQQARLIYNDFGLADTFGVPIAGLEALNLFRTPFGDVGRNTFTGLPFYSVNLSVFKTTKITENVKLEFRLEAFNILNRRNFGVPDAITEDANNGFVVSSFQNPGFNGGDKRTWRLGLRLIF